jgi:hypothetical protein
MKLSPHEWYRSRTYLHFDLPISIKKASKIVPNPELVAKHAFYPLIHYKMEVKKVSKDPITKKVAVALPIKERPISYPAHLDSQIYSYYSKVLNELYEKKLKKNDLHNSILAFRSVLGKSNIGFALDAFNAVKDFGECCVVALDVSKFFDTLNHNHLKKEWCDLLQVDKLPKDHFNVYKSITKSSKVNKDDLYKLLGISLNYSNHKKRRVCEIKEFREKVRANKLVKPHPYNYGIPQGTPLSAMLSNIYMFGFDYVMKNYMNDFNGKYFRYCDDMLFIVPVEKEAEIQAFATVEIEKIGLSLNINKTEIRKFSLCDDKLTADKNLQYLGFTFDGNNISIRSSSLARYSTRMRKGIRLAKKTMQKHNNILLESGRNERGLYKKKLYSRYTHLGKRNFITYGLRAAKEMDSESIKKQLKPLFYRFKEELNKP